MHRRTLLQTLGLAPFFQVGRAVGLDLSASTRADEAPAVAPDVALTLTAAPGEVSLLPGAPTKVWRFTGEVTKGPAATLQVLDGSYLGPVIRLTRGQRVRIRFVNRLGEPSIVHWHGLDAPEVADGHPRLVVKSGAEYVYDFTVTNRAGTYWYHPHPHMRTAAQVYQGLAGMLIVSDPEEQALGLPSGAGELLCVLQDRRFDAKNQLVYASDAAGGGMPGGAMGGGRNMGRGGGGGGGGMGMGGGMDQMMATMNGWLGDRMLVSGRVQPVRAVDRRTYRVRLLNGSNARFYKLAWSDGTAMTVIGSDGGLLERPLTQPALTLAPGQRAEVILDLSSHAPGSTVQLNSMAFPSQAYGIHDAGWTDTVVVLPGETVRVQITFSTHPGLYLYHCHILEHEDMGMMRNFRIRA